MIVLKYKRKESIFQMQITDFIFKPKMLLLNASIPNQRIEALKSLTGVPRKKNRKRGRKKNFLKSFYKIDHFVKKGALTPIKPAYLRRFREVRILPESEITYYQISKVEKIMLRA